MMEKGTLFYNDQMADDSQDVITEEFDRDYIETEQDPEPDDAEYESKNVPDDFGKPKQISENSLSFYMQRIANNHPLTKEEEQTLGRRIRNGDKEAFDKLVNANLKFVITMAYRFRNSGLPLSDIINQGNLGLLKAAKRYDPDKGVKFISYAVWWVRQYIIQGIAEQSGTVRFPIKQAGNLFKVKAVKETLTRRFGREASTDEIAQHLNMKETDVRDALGFAKQSLSLETPVKDGEDTTFVDFLKSSDTSIEDDLCKKDLKNILGNMINELSPREKEIINLRFGFGNDESMTLDELGKIFGVSRERVRQIECRALDKLKKKAVRKGLQIYLAS
ncbi:MAG: RNA polymerase sigma factor RpoD/SigA [Deferribacteraceae bacterium]|jgi:RNA polymerase primary sigma factor|nr:RNA polymerase sigma factor RpoD/SigA [Deferribacteraceae bacterium]